MKAFTKEEIQKFTPEQQVEFAKMEAQSIETRQRLLKQARGFGRGFGLVIGTLMAVVFGLASYGMFQPRAITFSIIVVVVLINVHAAALHRRLDSVMRLLDHNLGAGQTPEDENRGKLRA